MQIIISNTHQESSKKAASAIADILQQKNHPLLCVASGDSPTAIYQNLVERVQQKELDISHWHFLGLDEWVGMNGRNEGSCRYHLNAQLFTALQINEDRICFFDGAAKDLDKECQNTEAQIASSGGIELAILGLGMNGHLGMNEPGTTVSSRSHVIDLDPITAQVGQKYFQSPQILKQGITLGLANLMEAKTILLMVNGEKKAKILAQVINGEISEKIPASILRLHPNCYVYADQAAAQLLQKED